MNKGDLLALVLVFNFLACIQAYSSTFSYSDSSVSGSGTFVDIPITVSGLPSSLSDVSVVRVRIYMTPSSGTDPIIFLVSPSGKQVNLYYRGRTYPSVFADMEFRDDGTSFAAGVSGVGSLGLPWIPVQRLNQFNGEDPNGVWYLRVRTFGNSAWTVNSWKLYLADGCDLNPCLNGGYCNPISFQCDCDVNYEGRLCENSFNIIGDEFVIGTQQHVFLPDYESSTVGVAQSTLTVPDINFVGDTQARAFVTLPHSFIGDVRLYLSNPSNSQVTLMYGNGGGNANCVIDTEFNDNGTVSASSTTWVSNVPNHGPLQPISGTLNSIANVTYGTWTLRGEDWAGVDVGTFYRWSLHLSGPNACPVELFDNARYGLSGIGKMVNGKCVTSYYGFTSRGCVEVDGKATWEEPSGECLECPPNSSAPSGSTDLEDCACNYGYAKDSNQNCTQIFCSAETLEGVNYPQTAVGQTYNGEASCPVGQGGTVQRLCSQTGSSAVWLTPSSTCSSNTCSESLGFPVTYVGYIASVNDCPSGKYGSRERECVNTNSWGIVVDNCQSCPSGSTSLVGTALLSGCVSQVSCSQNNGGCATGAICDDSGGAIVCSCPAEGLFSQTVGNQFDSLINCAVNQFGSTPRYCGTNGDWSPPSSNCQNCPSGYTSPPNTLSSSGCVDVDECQSDPCSVSFSFCYNFPGDYGCFCLPGFDGDGKVSCSPNQRTNSLSTLLPIARFLFDGTLVDSTGNENTINIGKSSYYPFYQRDNSNNYAILVDTNSDVITSPLQITSNKFTIEVLFNVLSLTSLYDLIVLLPSPTSTLSQSILSVSGDSNRRIQWFGANRVKLGVSVRILRVGVTHSLVISVRNGKIITFLDNTQLGTFDMTISPGSYTLQVANNFMGFVDEVGFYGAAIYSPPGNTLNNLVECINTCPSGQVCVNTPNTFGCQAR